jgi:hypothetical protein
MAPAPATHLSREVQHISKVKKKGAQRWFLIGAHRKTIKKKKAPSAFPSYYYWQWRQRNISRALFPQQKEQLHTTNTKMWHTKATLCVKYTKAENRTTSTVFSIQHGCTAALLCGAPHINTRGEEERARKKKRRHKSACVEGAGAKGENA